MFLFCNIPLTLPGLFGLKPRRTYNTPLEIIYCLTRALETDPKNRDALVPYLRGQQLKKASESTLAFLDFKNSIKKNSSQIESYIESIYLHIQQQEYRKAYKLLKRTKRKARHLITQNDLSLTPDQTTKLLFPFQVYLEIKLNKNKALRETMLAFEESLLKDYPQPGTGNATFSTILPASGYLLLAFSYFHLEELPDYQEAMEKAMQLDWDAPIHPLLVRLLSENESLGDYFFNTRSHLAKRLWSRETPERQKEWYKDTLERKTREALLHPFL